MIRILSIAALLVAVSLPAQDRSDRALVFVHGTVYDGSGDEPIADAAVVVQKGRITAIGPFASTAVPDGAEVIDCKGRYLIPGLIDTHVHYSQTGWADGRPDSRDLRDDYPYEQAMAQNAAHPDRFHRAFLACGVTAVFDVGGFPWTLKLGPQTEDSSLAPHVTATGPLITPFAPEILSLPDQKQFALMKDEDHARALVRSHAAAGSTAIKIWFVHSRRMGITVEGITPYVMAVGDEASKLGLPLVVHATSLESARVAVDAGAHLLVHSVEDKLVDDEFIEALLDAKTIYCPTLRVGAGYVQLHARAPDPQVLELLPFVHPSVRERILSTAKLEPAPRRSPRAVEAMAKRLPLKQKLMANNLATLHRAGVPIAMGTDAGNPMTLHGPSVFIEMEAMQAAGLTASEVLRASTHDAALAMSRDDIGRLAVGCVADLLLLAKDPGEDIANLRSLTHVCRAGVLHEREALLQK